MAEECTAQQILDLEQRLQAIDLLVRQLEDAFIYIYPYTLNEDPVQIWCADLTKNIQQDTKVGLIEVPASRRGQNIRPAFSYDNPYNKTAEYNKTRDGFLQPYASAKVWSFAYNFICETVWKRDKPTYRYGQIISIDYLTDTCNILLEPLLEYIGEETINLNKSEYLNNVPIQYMYCNSAAFDTDDIVLIGFNEQKWEQPKVIGFREHPKPCRCQPAKAFINATSALSTCQTNKRNWIESYYEFVDAYYWRASCNDTDGYWYSAENYDSLGVPFSSPANLWHFEDDKWKWHLEGQEGHIVEYFDGQYMLSAGNHYPYGATTIGYGTAGNIKATHLRIKIQDVYNTPTVEPHCSYQLMNYFYIYLRGPLMRPGYQPGYDLGVYYNDCRIHFGSDTTNCLPYPNTADPSDLRRYDVNLTELAQAMQTVGFYDIDIRDMLMYADQLYGGPEPREIIQVRLAFRCGYSPRAIGLDISCIELIEK